VKVDVSWFLIAVLLTWLMWDRFVRLYDRSDAVAGWMAIASWMLFFASVLPHEIARLDSRSDRWLRGRDDSVFLVTDGQRTRLVTRCRMVSRRKAGGHLVWRQPGLVVAA
jgi:hypothetical protein